MALEINALDTLGRSVLHLACSSTEASSLEYVRMLLAHPAINVNILDKESHWTPLHRALYVGNVSAAYVSIFTYATGAVFLTEFKDSPFEALGYRYVHQGLRRAYCSRPLQLNREICKAYQ
jgi:hypothetical protein